MSFLNFQITKEFCKKHKAALLSPQTIVLLFLCCCALQSFFLIFELYSKADGMRLAGDLYWGADFLDVYASGLLVHLGHPEHVYHFDVLYPMQQSVLGYIVPFIGWYYPPPFLAVAAAIALIPYKVAFFVYIGTSFVTYSWVVYRLMPRSMLSLGCVAAFPGVALNVIAGQNGFITTTLMGAGFLLLESQPWLAGLMFGLLSYKPHYFILIPLMLAVCGYRKAFVSTLLSAFACFVVSLLFFGRVTWQTFLDVGLPSVQHDSLDSGAVIHNRMQSVYSLAHMWGAGTQIAYLVQGGAALLAVSVALVVWRRKPPLATCAAALGASLFLASPYSMDYDLVMLAVPMAMLVRQGVVSAFIPGEKILLGALWLLPPLATVLGYYQIPSTPLLMILLLGLCVVRSEKHVLSA